MYFQDFSLQSQDHRIHRIEMVLYYYWHKLTKNRIQDYRERDIYIRKRWISTLCLLILNLLLTAFFLMRWLFFFPLGSSFIQVSIISLLIKEMLMWRLYKRKRWASPIFSLSFLNSKMSNLRLTSARPRDFICWWILPLLAESKITT